MGSYRACGCSHTWSPVPQHGRKSENLKALFRGHRQSRLLVPRPPAVASPSGSDPVYAGPGPQPATRGHHAGCVHKNTDWKAYW